MHTLRDMVKRGLARSRRLAVKPACDHAGARIVEDRPLFRAYFCDRCGEAFNEFKPFNFSTEPEPRPTDLPLPTGEGRGEGKGTDHPPKPPSTP